MMTDRELLKLIAERSDWIHDEVGRFGTALQIIVDTLEAQATDIAEIKDAVRPRVSDGSDPLSQALAMLAATSAEHTEALARIEGLLTEALSRP